MTIRVFICADPTVPFGDPWEPVGTLEGDEPSINTRAAKKLHSIPSGGQARISFYLSGAPDARWVLTPTEHGRFGIAFDLLDDGARVLVAQRPASVTELAIRAPQPHPGLLVRPVMVPIKVNSSLRRA